MLIWGEIISALLASDSFFGFNASLANVFGNSNKPDQPKRRSCLHIWRKVSDKEVHDLDQLGNRGLNGQLHRGKLSKEGVRRQSFAEIPDERTGSQCKGTLLFWTN